VIVKNLFLLHGYFAIAYFHFYYLGIFNVNLGILGPVFMEIRDKESGSTAFE